MNNKYIESIAIVAGVFLVFLVQMTILSTYSSYLLAVLIIFFAIFITMKKRSKSASQLFTGSPLELFGIVSIITFIISLTNGLNSPLFFFLYFLIFLLAFMAESITIWIFLAAIILFFLPQASQSFIMDTAIKLGSLVLISPIAYFVAKEFERRQKLTEEVEAASEEIIQEAEALKDSGTPKSAEEEEAIDDIIEEASALKENTQH